MSRPGAGGDAADGGSRHVASTGDDGAGRQATEDTASAPGPAEDRLAAGTDAVDATRPPSGDADLSVLGLVTTAEADFYAQQVEGLATEGVATTTLSVPGRHRDREARRSPLDYLRLARAVRRQPLDRFDLVHANYGLTGPAALAQRRLPVVLSLWGSDLLGTFGPVSRLCARPADAVVVMTRDMARAVGRDCHVVPHGVDLELFRPVDRRTACERVGWDPDRRHVLFPYPTARKVKNYPVAERVVAAADERLAPPVDLAVGGGEIPHREMPTYMSAADALLLPSEREGSPNTVKEALACNLPVVATPVGDVPERLAGVEPSRTSRSEAGLVDALVSVLRRGERSNGREALRADGLDADRTAGRLRAVYDEVLAASG